MKLSSGIAAVVALALAVLALVMLRIRPAASTTQAIVDGETAAVGTSGDGRPHAATG